MTTTSRWREIRAALPASVVARLRLVRWSARHLRMPGVEAPRHTNRSLITTVALVCAVAAAALVVHAPVLRYPFIQDDWSYLYRVLFADPLRLVGEQFTPFGKHFYRPIWPLYFLLVGKVFGLQPVLSHAIGLVLHIGSSLLVVVVLARLTRDTTIGWLAGILYASASFVHMDPLLWASGIFENGSIFLALVSLWLFMRGHSVRSAIAFAAALLFKESVVFLPSVFLAVACVERAQGRRALPLPRRLIQRWIPICAVMASYGGIKLAGVSPLSLPPEDPYVMRLTGSHVLQNLSFYGRWGVEALFPSDPVSLNAAICWFTLLAVALVAGALMRHTPSGTIPLAVWLVGSMCLYVFLPNHLYRYYLTAPLPVLVGLTLVGLRVGCRLVRMPPRPAMLIMIAFTTASVISSFVHFHRIDIAGPNQAYREGTNDLVRRAATVVAVRDGLLKAHSTLPPGSQLLLKGVDLVAFGDAYGVRVWYREPTIDIVRPRDLVENCGRWFLRRDTTPDEVVELAGPHSERPTRDSILLLSCELRANRLVEVSEDDVGDVFPVGPMARLYFAHFNRVPDRGTLQYWVAQQRAGLRMGSIARAFSGSDEFQSEAARPISFSSLMPRRPSHR